MNLVLIKGHSPAAVPDVKDGRRLSFAVRKFADCRGWGAGQTRTSQYNAVPAKEEASIGRCQVPGRALNPGFRAEGRGSGENSGEGESFLCVLQICSWPSTGPQRKSRSAFH